MRICRIRIYEVNLDFTQPASISYKTWTRVNNLLTIVDTDDGLSGYGEAAPFKPITGDSLGDSLRFLHSATKRLIGKKLSSQEEIRPILDKVSRDLGFFSSTGMAALESSCYDIVGKMLGKPIYRLLGSSEPKLSPNTVTIYLGATEDITDRTRDLLARYSEHGLSRIKLKLSGDPEADLHRVLSVAKVHTGLITLDANQAYPNPDMAIDLFNRIHDRLSSQVALVEEPCPKRDLRKLKKVTDNSRIPTFADESAATLDDIKRIVEDKAANGINLKLQKVGGITRGLEAVRLASMSNIEVMVGCMMEGGTSIACGTNFATGVDHISCTDLDTDLELRNDVIIEDSKPLFIHGSRVPLDRPGLGVELGRLPSPIYTID